VVRNTRGVTGFVGPGSKPIPLTEDEVRNMGIEARRVEIDIHVGQAVRVTAGPFEDLSGFIEAINEDKQSVRVKISMFGRETPVELEYSQIETI